MKWRGAGRWKARVALIALIALAVAAALSATRVEGSASASVARGGTQLMHAKSASCNLEVDLRSRRYRYARLPPNALVAGARLSGRARLQCEPELFCRASGGCALLPGKVVGRLVARRIRGIKPSLALIDADSKHIYVNRKIFPVFAGGKRLLRLLRKGGGPQPDDSQAPPRAYLVSGVSARFPLAMGDYCWSSPSGNQTWVQGCALTAPPSSRFDIPLVVAEPGASLQAVLGFGNPNSVRVSLLRNGKIYYSESLSAAQTFTWIVPGSALARSFLEIEAGRTAPGASQDWVKYLARLRVVEASGTG
jgi:hypothetical protein